MLSEERQNRERFIQMLHQQPKRDPLLDTVNQASIYYLENHWGLEDFVEAVYFQPFMEPYRGTPVSEAVIKSTIYNLQDFSRHYKITVEWYKDLEDQEKKDFKKKALIGAGAVGLGVGAAYLIKKKVNLKPLKERQTYYNATQSVNQAIKTQDEEALKEHLRTTAEKFPDLKEKIKEGLRVIGSKTAEIGKKVGNKILEKTKDVGKSLGKKVKETYKSWKKEN